MLLEPNNQRSFKISRDRLLEKSRILPKTQALQLNLHPVTPNVVEPIPIEHDIDIPNEIHLIWLGSALPEKYLLHIYDLIALKYLEKFQVNLWVDKESNFYSTVYKSLQLNKFSPASMDALVKLINLRNIKEILILYENLFASQDYADREFNLKTIKKLLMIADKERIGSFSNYAAAADIYRYLILYLLGGFYIDIDNKINFTKIKNDQASLMHNLDAQYGFLYHSPNMEGINNDLLLSAKHHPILKKLLIQIENQYAINKKEHLLDVKDLKRSEFNYSPITPNRRTLTIQFTGPEALFNSFNEYKRQYKLLSPDRGRLLIFNDNYFDIKCDKNWLTNNAIRTPKTDEDLHNNDIILKNIRSA